MGDLLSGDSERYKIQISTDRLNFGEISKIPDLEGILLKGCYDEKFNPIFSLEVNELSFFGQTTILKSSPNFANNQSRRFA